MKIVILTGSPRKNGNSAKLVSAFAEESRLFGNEVEIFDTAFLKIDGCRHCEGCYKTGKPCVFEDDFNRIASAIECAEGVVFASPLYWSSFTAQLKACIDRFFCFYNGKKLSCKKFALLGTCQDVTESAFAGMLLVYRGVITLLDGVHVGEVLVPNVYAMGEVEKTDGIDRAKELARRFK